MTTVWERAAHIRFFSIFIYHGVQRRMISVVNFFVFLRLLFFALLLLYVALCVYARHTKKNAFQLISERDEKISFRFLAHLSRRLTR